MPITEFLESNDVLDNPEELRDRAKRDGYLFFRGLLKEESLLNLRRQILELCQEAGWVQEGSDLMQGQGTPGITYVEGQPEHMEVYAKVQKLESFHSLAHEPELLDVLQKLFGEEVLVHARNIARMMFPQNNIHATPPHQDHIHIQGTAETYTAWIPLSDCPKELGSLSVLAGSHHAGMYKYKPEAYGAGKSSIDVEELPHSWAEGDLKLGDFLFFHSMMVHKALPNLTSSSMRLSVDYRYQGRSQPLVEASMQPHFGKLPWDEIYKGWKSTQYQYYWENLGLNYVPFDTSHYDDLNRQREAMAGGMMGGDSESSKGSM